MLLSNNLTEMKSQVKELQEQIYKAVSPIINLIQVPCGVELNGINLRLICTQEIGKSNKEYLLDMPKIDITLNLNKVGY